MISRIAFPAGGALIAEPGAGPFCGRERANGDLGFIAVRLARQLLDRAPVKITGRKVHGSEIAGVAQHRVDRADAFEELRPIDRRLQAHSGDHVADGHVHRALVLNFFAHDLVGCCALRCQPVVQPAQWGSRVGIAIAQSLRQLYPECGRPRCAIELLQAR